RLAGKPVVAYLEAGGGRGDLYLTSACTRVVATEEASFEGLGLRVERRYYRKLLADWGVRIDRSSYGRYKSAYREFSADSTPPAGAPRLGGARADRGGVRERRDRPGRERRRSADGPLHGIEDRLGADRERVQAARRARGHPACREPRRLGPRVEPDRPHPPAHE